MFFQHAFGNDIFSKFYIKNVIFGVQVAPQLGVKNLQIFMIFVSGAPKTQWEPQKPHQSLPWTPPGASESLENELLDIENLHFSTPRLLKTQAKSLFLLVRGLRKSLFLAFKIAYKSMFFQHAFGICDFIIFYTTTHLFGLQLGPQLGVKNPSCFLIFVS